VNKHVVHVSASWLFVGFSCKTRKSLFVDKYSQRVKTIEHDVDSEIVFEVFDNVRVC